jgi:hypothetical protein
MHNETWRPVPGIPHYEVSNAGRVRSVDHWTTVRRRDHANPHRRFHRGRIIATPPGRTGYPKFTAAPAPGMPRVNLDVHVCVLRAFRGPPPPGHECLHRDGGRTNCRLSNLRWGTRSRNAQERKHTGNMGTGTRSGKLKPFQVVAILKAFRKPRYGQMAALARTYGVTPVAIRNIKIRKAHRDIAL